MDLPVFRIYPNLFKRWIKHSLTWKRVKQRHYSPLMDCNVTSNMNTLNPIRHALQSKMHSIFALFSCDYMISHSCDLRNSLRQAETRWLVCYRLHVQIHILEWKPLTFEYNIIEICHNRVTINLLQSCFTGILISLLLSQWINPDLKDVDTNVCHLTRTKHNLCALVERWSCWLIDLLMIAENWWPTIDHENEWWIIFNHRTCVCMLANYQSGERWPCWLIDLLVITENWWPMIDHENEWWIIFNHRTCVCMLVNYQSGLVAFTWGQFYRKCSRFLSLTGVWKWLI